MSEPRAALVIGYWKMSREQRRLWVWSLLLMAPAALPYLSHYLLKPDGRIPTGFVQYDMAQYMALAREHFDGATFRLTYGNPFSPSYETPPIYFQPLILGLGIVWRLSGWDPGVVFVAVGFAT